MPDQLEAFKLAELTGIRNRTMFVALVIASVVGVVSTLISFSSCRVRRGNRRRIRADSLRRIRSIQLPLRLANQSQIHRLVWDVNSRANIFRQFGRHVSPHPICLVSFASGRIRHWRCPRHPNHQCTLAATGDRNCRQVANTKARRSQSLSSCHSLFCWLSAWRGSPRLLLANNQSCPAHLGLQLLLSQQEITTPTAYSCFFSRDDALYLTRGCLASRIGRKVKMPTVCKHSGTCMSLRSFFYLTRTLKYVKMRAISHTSQHRRSLLAPVFIGLNIRSTHTTARMGVLHMKLTDQQIDFFHKFWLPHDSPTL